ncbi:MAG: hypothetical protein LBT15_07755 [Synergistaceae bacterium]|jgi:hypothetical protein|nr:hypothetical protein [Synergistaceae bacterium]
MKEIRMREARMKKGLCCLLTGFLFSLCTAVSAWAALPYYSYYQLRDVSGPKDGHTVAGSQWFATVTQWHQDGSGWVSYRDTDGGEAPEVPMVTSADLVSNFNGVYLEDPQYNALWGDDISFDPIESVCLVIMEGRGELRLNFGNYYAHHVPYGPQPAMEDVLLSVPDYTARVVPGRPELVSVDSWLETDMTFQADSPQGYGSSLGYLTFRQSASFDTGFTGYRESIKIPLVVANVFDGTAAEAGNELLFDMTVMNGSEPVTRQKFRWGADQDMTRDLGTFFMMIPAGASMPTYELRTEVTNRTGTRYRAQRYDSGGSAYQEILPRHWMYDVPSDLYGTLPAYFSLESQSQIAPGLVTVYSADMSMNYGSGESFRLYPWQGSSAPRDLRLTFRKVGGMTPLGTASASTDITPPWTVTAFDMTFADVMQNGENTADEIAKHAGGQPVMPGASFDLSGVSTQYIRADAFNAFTVSSLNVTVSGDVTSDDVVSDAPADVPLLPLRVRLRVSRREAPLVGRWNDIVNADSVIDAFASVCAVWIRSDAAAERDMNLFTTLRNRGYGVDRCVQAFTYGDFLYLDFIVLLADAVSQNTGKTAFCQVVEDDGVPYILIGDGRVDGKWNLSFFVALTGENPSVNDPALPSNPGQSGGGGGCNEGISTAGALLAVLLLLSGVTRKNNMR